MFRGFFDDSFFGLHDHQHRRRFMNQIEDNEDRHPSERHRSNNNRCVTIADPFDHRSMFSGNMNSIINMRDSFSMFDNMMPNMKNMMDGTFSESMSSGGQDGFGFSSVRVSTYTNDGSGQPKVFEASRSTKHAPGGLKETHKSLRDTEAGLEKMAIGRHIKDRGHVITRERNTRSGDMMENQDFLGFTEDQAGRFDQDWLKETKQYGGKGRQFLKHPRKPRHERLELE